MTYSHLVPPNGTVNNPDLPLPWEPEKRLSIINKFYVDNLPDCLPNGSDRDTDERLKSIQQYLRGIDNRYIITGVGVLAVQKTILNRFPGKEYPDPLYNIHRTERHWQDVQKEFEREALGLEPSDSEDGLYYWASSAGFAGGVYPIEPFAELIDISTDSFRDVLYDKKATKFGGVMLRYANYLVPVMKGRSIDHVRADQATELNPLGVALIENALSIAEGVVKYSE